MDVCLCLCRYLHSFLPFSSLPPSLPPSLPFPLPPSPPSSLNHDALARGTHSRARAHTHTCTRAQTCLGDAAPGRERVWKDSTRASLQRCPFTTLQMTSSKIANRKRDVASLAHLAMCAFHLSLLHPYLPTTQPHPTMKCTNPTGGHEQRARRRR